MSTHEPWPNRCMNCGAYKGHNGLQCPQLSVTCIKPMSLNDVSAQVLQTLGTPTIEQQLESQHRKTWALAMEAAAEVYDVWNKSQEFYSCSETIRALACPPIEATKDK